MRSIEQQVAAALAAEAEQVRAADLAPLVVPAPVGGRLRALRTGSAWAPVLAAAAAAAVVASVVVLPGVLGGDDGAVRPAPPAGSRPAAPSTAPSETTAGPEEGTAEDPVPSAVVEELRADVDGDGREDRVRFLAADRRDEEPVAQAVEVRTATGARSLVALEPAYLPTVLPPAELGGAPGEELLLRLTGGGDGAAVLVLTWVDGALERAVPTGRQPLLLALGGNGVVASTWVDDQGLGSWLLVDPQGTGREADLWRWSLAGTTLTAARAGTACTDPGDPDVAPYPC